MEQARYEQVNIGRIVESPVNAQVMPDAEFRRLVKNVKHDGGLTATVLLMEQQGSDRLMCISGHHRIKACKKAEINDVPAMIIPPIPESDRIRLQLSHNDIHGEPDIEIVHELLGLLGDIDRELVSDYGVEKPVSTLVDAQEEEYRHVSICLKPESADLLIGLIDSISGDEKMIIEEEEFDDMKKALTMAFRAGFKTPGKAFRRFIDLVLNHKDEFEA